MGYQRLRGNTLEPRSQFTPLTALCWPYTCITPKYTYIITLLTLKVKGVRCLSRYSQRFIGLLQPKLHSSKAPMVLLPARIGQDIVFSIFQALGFTMVGLITGSIVQ